MKNALRKACVNITWIYLIFVNNVLAENSPFATVDEKSSSITTWLTGTFAMALGTIALVTVFVGMMFGKINISFALIVIFSIVGMFTADTIVGFFAS
ncbi:MAG: hypothetical protein HOM96_02345 [Rickettsiales bacterium]|jgi:type IV secretory pathway VirB2 component (pilin)|nr:hypothetical protein [Rickettsiales bacterium]